MAAGIWPDLTDANVVCQSYCKHLDCKSWKDDAERLCPHCNKTIQAGDRFYRLDEPVDGLHAIPIVAHARCVEKEIDNEI